MQSHETLTAERQIREHNADTYAHGPLSYRMSTELAATNIEALREFEVRMTRTEIKVGNIERFTWVMTGVGLAAAAAVGGGLLGQLFRFGH